MVDTGTLTSFDRSYTIGRLKRQARSLRLEAARGAAMLATQLTNLAATIEAEAAALEFGFEERVPAWKSHP